MKKRALEMSFSWIFAIIVGAFILFLAIFFISKFSGTQNLSTDTKSSKTIMVLADSFEIGYEDSSVNKITMPTNSRLYLECYNHGAFGEQELILRSEVYNQWSEPGRGIRAENKYFFFEQPLEAKEIMVFSKPFEFPFKVATLNYLIPISQEYCFLDSPSYVKEELEKINLPNLKASDRERDCFSNSIRVCFDDSYSYCDIIVNTRLNFIEKETNLIYYYEIPLMFAGIFSEPELYNCQLKRLMKRTASLSELYLGKIDYDTSSGCFENQRGDLTSLRNFALNLGNSRDLSNILDLEEMNYKNSRAPCPLW